MFLVDIDDLLHLVVTPEEDAAPVVNAFWDNIEHAPHFAVDCETAGY